MKNKKFLKILTLIVAFTLILSGCTIDKDKKDKKNTDNSSSDFTVYTSIYPVEAMVKYIAGDRINVINIMPANGDVHSWEPKAQDIINVSEADILFINGLGIEHWLDDFNEIIDDLDVVDLSEGIDLLVSDSENNKNTQSNEDSQYDPHIWLSLENLRIELKTIYEKLSALDKEDEPYFKENLTKYSDLIDKLISESSVKFEEYKGKSIIVPHDAFGYLCREMNIKQIGIEGINSDSEPGTGRMKEIIDMAKEEKITTVFYDINDSEDASKTIANEIGARLVGITTLEINPDEKDFFELYKDNLDKIIDSFK